MSASSHELPAAGRYVLFRAAGAPLEILSASLPPVTAGQTLVRIDCATLCGSDLHTYTGRRQEPTPLVLGHEMVGRIVAVGPGAAPVDLKGDALNVGERVTWSIVVGCGSCFFCDRGLPQKCTRLFKFGHRQHADDEAPAGALADYCLLPAGTPIVRVAAAIPDPLAATLNCTGATAAACLRAAQLAAGEHVVLFGAGMLGLWGVLLAKARGVGRVTVVERDAARRHLAETLGADDTLSPDDLPAWGAALATTAAGGADVAIELCGATEAAAAALAVLRIGGRLVLAGATAPAPPWAIQPQQIVRRLLSIVGVHNYAPDDLAAVVAWAAASDAWRPLVDQLSVTYPLADIERAFRHALDERPLRVAVRP